MYNMVHVDEKWFYEDVNKRSCLLFEDETALQRSRRSKNHVPKTMFLAVVMGPTQKREVGR
ncbi:hypothetical protein PC112_g22143 [Phytophthora cactorum]|nr:hypothetical protein PC112_g22143 [Phytophthora cactorum]KAG2977893.1 hypothetical protein PC120_g25412 [Phytophthora cactorum]KAG3046086.1 hypothetical protein PC121_g20901 [Phytophthora cactorum]